MRFLLFFSVLCFAVEFCAPVLAQSASSSLPVASSADFELRIKKLESELRCLVCQNQTLADSPSSLAGDLRREVRNLALSGKSDEEIKQYLQSRYGDFVLYKPPVARYTWLLWFGPFVLLGGGLIVWMIMTARRRQGSDSATPSISKAEQQRAQALLRGDEAGR